MTTVTGDTFEDPDEDFWDDEDEVDAGESVPFDQFLDRELEDSGFRDGFVDARCRHDAIVELVNARKRAGMTQAALAERMGTTQSAVSELEGGETDPRLSTLQRYARAAGTELSVSVEGRRLHRAPLFIHQTAGVVFHRTTRSTAVKRSKFAAVKSGKFLTKSTAGRYKQVVGQ